MNIIVTGGAGFIGSHVADRLIEMGHSVHIVDDLSTGMEENLNDQATFHNVDIRDAAALAEVFEKANPDYVFHFAAQIDARKAVVEPVLDSEINIIGSLNLLELCRKHDVRKVIFSSTGGVMYGQTDVRPTPETEMPAPETPYAISKLTTDNHLHFYHTVYGLKYTSLRFGNVYGPRQNPHGEAGVVAIFTTKMLAGEAATIFGDGANTRDYVFVGDIVNACIAAMEHEDVVGVFNVGTGRETAVKEIASHIADQTEEDWTPENAPARPEQANSALDASRVEQTLGWTPQVPLEEGIAQTVEWFKQKKS